MQHDPGPGFGDTECDRERYKEHDREQKLENCSDGRSWYQVWSSMSGRRSWEHEKKEGEAAVGSRSRE